MSTLAVRCVVDARCAVGESPLWSPGEQALYWADIPAGRLHRWHPEGHRSCVWQLPAPLGSFGLRRGGGLVLALKTGVHLFEPNTGTLSLLCHLEPLPIDNRLNDGKVSPDGSFWVGSMSEQPTRPAVAALYRLDAAHRGQRVLDGLRVSNGLAWSPDGRTLYHADTRALTVWRHDHDLATGALSNRRVFITMRPEWGRPDGATVDSEGCYWNAGIGAGRVNRFSPEGELISHIELPVSHPTMPCFGGPGLRTLYVTSLRDGVAAEALARMPQSGGVFAVEVDVAGIETALYAG